MKLTDILILLNDLFRIGRFIDDFIGGRNVVDDIVISDGGTGYTTSFTVPFTGGTIAGGGHAAEGEAVVSGGEVVGITMTDRGAGYTSPPTPDFSAGSGTGASALAVMVPTDIDAVATVNVQPGAILFWADASIFHVYKLYESVAAESSPDIIRPDDFDSGDNAKVWFRQDTETAGGGGGTAQKLYIHAPVAAATTANITLSGEQTIDGVLTSASRVLVKDQTDATENGIYLSGAGVWVRVADLDEDSEALSGAWVFVLGGTTWANTGWVITTADPITLTVTEITWERLDWPESVFQRGVNAPDEAWPTVAPPNPQKPVLSYGKTGGQIAEWDVLNQVWM